jgi:hypothetical protein
MGICTTCSPDLPGFVYVDQTTRAPLPKDVAPLDYETGTREEYRKGRGPKVATLPCPECNAGRRRVFLAAPTLMGERADRAGYPEPWDEARDPVSWRAHQRGGPRQKRPNLRIVKQDKLIDAAERATVPPDD